MYNYFAGGPGFLVIPHLTGFARLNPAMRLTKKIKVYRGTYRLWYGDALTSYAPLAKVTQKNCVMSR